MKTQAEPLRLFNTLTRTVEDFKPMVAGKVGLYACGPTVYSYAHIGNMRSYIFVDTLRRSLAYLGYEVKHVMNITDVGHLTDDADSGEDKLEVGSRREGLTAWDVARKYTDAFFDHADQLNIQRPTIVCKATDYIAEQVEMVKTLDAKGYTYTTADGVYFDTSKFSDYTKLGRLDVKGLQEGLRVEVGEKRNKTDFALWKFSKPEDKRAMEWDAPWGRGFPGWHIECSAMSVKLLGAQFDIHTGGVDHIPIHHSNEVAQSECATGKTPFVRYWMHGEFLVIDDAEKMSKSSGHVMTVATLSEKGFDPLAYRLFILQGHYRKQLKFSFESLAGSQKGLGRLRMLIAKNKSESQGLPAAESDKSRVYKAQFKDAVANDLNMPQALATLFSLLEDSALSPGEKVGLAQHMDEVFGLELEQSSASRAGDIPQAMLDLLKQRNDARAGKDWAEADRLRKAIAAQGYEILDSPEGSSLKRKL